MRVRTGPALAGVLTCVMASVAWAQSAPGQPDYLFWTWDEPAGEAASNPLFVPMVKQFIPTSDPMTSADPHQRALDVVATALDLNPSELCIVFTSLGWGGPGNWDYADETPLMFDPCDGLPAPDNTCLPVVPGTPEDKWWGTPWTRTGTLRMRAWMEAFDQTLADELEANDLPPVSRAHLDMEATIQFQVLKGLPPQIGFDFILENFYSMMSDSRWDTEVIPGTAGFNPENNPGGGFADSTLSDLYAYSGAEAPSGTDIFAPQNHEWASWYESLSWTATDGALGSAVYEPIRQQWPQALTSNYQTSVRTRYPHQYRDYGGIGYTDLEVRPWGSGDLQAPVLYPVCDGHLQGEDRWTATMRVHRENIDAILRSQLLSEGARHPELVTPWMYINGVTSTPSECAHYVTAANVREMLLMLRSRGVKEFLMFAVTSESNWDDFNDVVAEALIFDQDEDQSLAYVDDDYSTITGKSNRGVYQATTSLTFDRDAWFGSGLSFDGADVVLEALSDASVVVEVKVMGASLGAVALTAAGPDDDRQRIVFSGSAPIGTAENVQVELLWKSNQSFTVQLDGVHLAGHAD